MSARRPVRVLHVIDSLRGGGSERWVWDIVRLSDPTQAVHRVVTIEPDPSAFVYHERLRQLGAWDGPPTTQAGVGQSAARPSSGRSVAGRVPLAWKHRLSTALVLSTVMPRAAYRLYQEYQRFRPDVIHAHVFYGFLAGLLLEAVSGRPLVYSVPSRFSHIADGGFDWMVGLYPHLHRLVDHFITAFPSELRAIGVPPAKITTVSVTADVPTIRAARDSAAQHRQAIRGQLGLGPEALIALSVGRLHSSKGHEHAVRALRMVAERFPDLHLVVLGEGPERPTLEGLARELGVEPRVHLVGFIEDPLPWYAAADLYLRTMVFEGDNQSSCQAMGMGLPVVGFDTGAHETDQLAAVGHGILVRNRDTQGLAAAVARVLALPDRGGTLGARGIAHCEAHLDTGRFVRGLVATYARLGRARRRARPSAARAGVARR